MPDLFPIIEALPEMRGDVEQMGSKPKFWFKHDQSNWLFKESRENTGEDWAEKIASEIAVLMGLPTHHAELAIWQGMRGCAVKSFLNPKKEVLIHGNELLGGFLDNYDKEKVRGQSDHTFENIVGVIEKLFAEGRPRRNGANFRSCFLTGQRVARRCSKATPGRKYSQTIHSEGKRWYF